MIDDEHRQIQAATGSGRTPIPMRWHRVRHPRAMAEPETSPWNVPNALTAFRIILVPVFAWMLLVHPDQPWWRFFTAVIFGVAILTDPCWTVTWHASTTSLPASASSPTRSRTKALTGMAFIGLSIIDELPWWVTVTILVREWGITIMRFVVLRYGVMAAGRGGKIKTVTQAIAVILYLLPLPDQPISSRWS